MVIRVAFRLIVSLPCHDFHVVNLKKDSTCFCPIYSLLLETAVELWLNAHV